MFVSAVVDFHELDDDHTMYSVDANFAESSILENICVAIGISMICQSLLELQHVLEKLVKSPGIFPGSGRRIEVPDDGRSAILTYFVARLSLGKVTNAFLYIPAVINLLMFGSLA